MKQPSAPGRVRLFERFQRRGLWLFAALLAALAYFSAHGVAEKLEQRDTARAARDRAEVGIVLGRLVHELQRERGLSGGLIASGGERCGPALSGQHARTDEAVELLRSRRHDWQRRSGPAHVLTLDTLLADLERLADLRRAVAARGLYRDEAHASYTRLIAAVFDEFTGAGGVRHAGRVERQQLAFLFFLQAKEMAGQERALLTAMLSAGDYGTVRRDAFQRIKAMQRAHLEAFRQLADDAVRAGFSGLPAVPYAAGAERLRQLVLATHAGDEASGRMFPQAVRWFELASREIDAMNDFERVLGGRLLQSAEDWHGSARRVLATSTAGIIVCLLLAGAILVQLWRGKALVEKGLHLAGAVFDHCIESIVIFDPDWRILEANDNFLRTNGYRHDEVAGRHGSLLGSGRGDEPAIGAMLDQLARTGAWQGEARGRRSNGEVYPVLLSVVRVCDPKGGTSHYISISVDLTKYRQIETMLEKLRTFDPLTGLLNRTAWSEAIGRAIRDAERAGGGFTLVDVGLDRFRTINESLGHAAGDQVLIGAAEKIRRALRACDMAARLGGDRFAVMLAGTREPAAIGAFRKCLQALFREPVAVDGRPLQITASIGVARFPDDGTHTSQLLRNAETALHSAKSDAHGGCRFYTAEMNAHSARLLDLEQRLRQALGRGEFSIAYQPQFDARDGTLVGAEALLRWSNPELGRVPPAQFIPIAEKTGVIVAIGEWVLRQACGKIQGLRERLGYDLRIAVNLSANQFLRDDLLAMVRGALDDSGLPAPALELEITEGLLMDDPSGAARILGALRGMGVKIALDDFGTGYSSLAYLKRFPVDRLKLDRAFVEGLPANESDRAISRTVIALGHNLGMDVLAEGVETREQREFLARAGCDLFQGRLFARPLTEDELDALVAGAAGR